MQRYEKYLIPICQRTLSSWVTMVVGQLMIRMTFHPQRFFFLSMAFIANVVSRGT